MIIIPLIKMIMVIQEKLEHIYIYTYSSNIAAGSCPAGSKLEFCQGSQVKLPLLLLDFQLPRGLLRYTARITQVGHARRPHPRD